MENRAPSQQIEDQVFISRSRTGSRGALTARNVVVLVAILAAAKGIVFAVVYLACNGQVPSTYIYPPPHGLGGVLQAVSTNWDGFLYQRIATVGYPTWTTEMYGMGSQLYAFSPVYPALIFLANLLTGSGWTAALVVSNTLGFIFPIMILRVFDFRTALLVEVFPTYIVYTMAGYSDALALTFLALAFFFFLKRRHLFAGVTLALAGLVLYDLLLAVLAFAGFMLFFQKKPFKGDGLRSYIALILPVMLTAIGILVAYQIETGNALTFFNLERWYWDVAPATPLAQAQWIFHGSGLGSFTGIDWSVLGFPLTPSYWLFRNILFEAFFFSGFYLLMRLQDPYKWLFVSYSLLMTVPLLLVQGTPVYSMPRLALAAFPIFFGYSNRLIMKRWQLAVYVLLSILTACWALFSFLFAFFA